jgi:ABC-type branched-subunit amino acid transport system ATPase component/branched-subunit amino acid ABC-type transport system permease component
MTVTSFIEFLLLGLGAGGAYALLGLGLVVVYKGSGVVNFAHGAIGLLGAAVFFETRDSIGTPAAIVAAVAAGALFGVMVQVLIMHPMRRASPLVRVIATLGIFSALDEGGDQRYGSIVHFVPAWLPSNAVRIGSVSIGEDRLIVLALTIALTAGLTAFYRYTRFGLATTGVVENPVATASMGWSPNIVAIGNWAAGGALAALAGVVLVPLTGLNANALAETIVPALAAGLVGGFSSFPLTLAGGLLIGMLESEATNYIHTTGVSSAAPFVVIILILVFRGRALPLRGELTQRLPRVGSGRARLAAAAIVVGLTVISIEIFSGNWLAAVITGCVYALISLSLVVVTGFCGQLSLAQFAFAGFGALVAGRLADAEHMTFLLALLIGVIATIPLGLVFAVPAVRVRGVNLAIITLGLAEVIDAIIFQNPSYTGGTETGTVVANPSVAGLDIDAVNHPFRYAVFGLVVVGIAALVVSNIRRSNTGRRFIAIRDNERAAASLGLSSAATKLYAFAIGAGIAALGGILGAFEYPNIVYTGYDVFGSINSVLYAVVGGVGYVSGALIGGASAPSSVTQEVLAHAFNISNWYTLIAALLLIVVVLINPDGIAEKISQQAAFVARFVMKPVRRAGPARGARSKVQQIVPSQKAPAHRVAGRTLELRDVSVRFGGVVAVDGVSFEVKPGEVVGLIGPNGAGKSTLVDAATGFNRRYSGSVLLDGVPIDDLRAPQRARRGITRSFQSLELFEDLTVADNLRVATDRRSLLGHASDFVRPDTTGLTDVALASIQEFGLTGVIDTPAADLPYAQRRLVGIARAVASAPSILLLDEPAAGLDETSTRELAALVRRLATEWGMGVLLIEHHVSMVMSTCDRVVAIHFGHSIASGTPDEIRRNERVIDAYLGSVEEQPVEEEVAP